MVTNTGRGIGLDELGHWLEQRRAESDTETAQEEARRKCLVARWTDLHPVVIEAIARVDAKLAERSRYRLNAISSPDFFGREYVGYGAEWKLVGREIDGYDTVPFVVTDDCFYVAGLHHWGEGLELPFDQVTVEAVADAVASAVKNMIEG
jgi:hypothetical protein